MAMRRSYQRLLKRFQWFESGQIMTGIIRKSKADFRPVVDSKGGIWYNPDAVVATCELVGFDARMSSRPLDLSRVLFLDFDGVLHKEGAHSRDEFCYAELLERTIRVVDPQGRLPIVISSMWRYQRGLVALRDHLPRVLSEQVVGVTPELPKAMQPGWLDAASIRTASREMEIEAWMREFSPAGEWLAIDDRSSLFSTDCPSLFLVGDDALCETEAQRLQVVLSGWVSEGDQLAQRPGEGA